MPANPEGLLPVEQRHRDYAADLLRETGWNEPEARRIELGQQDDVAEVQAFASFEQSLARPGMEAMREALEQIEAEVFPHPNSAHVYIDKIRRLARAALSQVPSQEGK